MNRLTIIGNLTRDPELRQTQGGKNVCNFTVAVNRRQKDANGQNEADFFRVAAWGEMGEACGKYLSKGKKVCVVGAVTVRTYQDNSGETKASLEIPFAQDVEFLSPKNDGDSGQAQSAAPAASAPAVKPGTYTTSNPDDLPF